MKKTAREIAEIIGVSERAVRKRLVKINPAEIVPSSGRHGQTALYAVSDLPEDYRHKIYGSSSSNGDTSIVRYPGGSGMTSPGSVNFNTLPEAAREKALAIADLLHALDTEVAAAKRDGKSKMDVIHSFLNLYNKGLLLGELKEKIGPVTRSTLYRWKQAFNHHGLAGIAPKFGVHKKGRSIVTKQEQDHLLHAYLNDNKPSVSEAIRDMRLTLRQLGLKSRSSDRTLSRWLERWSERNYDLVVLRREGEKALNDKVLPYIKRDRLALDVGECLVADGHVMNCWVIDELDGKKKRMSLVMFLDWRSGFPAGWAFSATEDTAVIHTALRNACINMGKIPKAVYLDNGRAFKARVFTGSAQNIDFKQAGFSGIYAALAIRLILALPYHGQSKIIERFFRILGELERKFPSFTGENIDRKPGSLMRNEKWLQQQRPDWVPTVNQMDRLLHAWFREMYGARGSKGLAKGETPLSVFDAGRGPGLSETELLNLMPVVERQLGREGVQMFGQHYYAPELYGIREMVDVRYDYADLRKVWICSKTHDFPATLAPIVGMEAAVADKDSLAYANVKQKNRDRKRLARITKDIADRQIADAQHIPSVVEIMDAAELPELPSATYSEQQSKALETLQPLALPTITTELPELPPQLPVVIAAQPGPDAEPAPAPSTPGNGKAYDCIENLLQPRPSVPNFNSDDDMYLYLVEHGIEDAWPEFVREFEESIFFEMTYGHDHGRGILNRHKQKGQEVRTQRQKKSQGGNPGGAAKAPGEQLTTIGG